MSEALEQTGKLSEEAIAFVKAGTPVPATAAGEVPDRKPAAKPQAAAAVIAPVDAPEAPVAKPVKKAPREREPEPVAATGLVSMTFRLPAEIPASLVRASADRKVKKERPFTQQEIVAEALAQWLKKAGFLG